MKNQYLLGLIRKYKKKGLFLDTNILLLYIIGSLDKSLIRNTKSTAMFDARDYEKIKVFIDYFDIKVTSPHVLTEVSDLLGESSNYQKLLKTFINFSIEKYKTSAEIAENKSFSKFGLADSAILEISKGSHLIFTADNRFYGYLNSIGVDALNFDSLKLAY
jgi:hypothetical protein